jgi:hypothetical protein
MKNVSISWKLQPPRNRGATTADFLPHPLCSPHHTLPKSVSKEYELCRRVQKKICKTSILFKSQHFLNGQSGRTKWTFNFEGSFKNPGLRHGSSSRVLAKQA